MNLIIIKDKEKLDNFLEKLPYSRFLQSWEWGEFQQQVGFGVKRVGLEKDGQLIVVATLIKKNLFFGRSYWYCPHGPIVNHKSRMKNYELLFKEIIKIAKKEKVIFLRFEPAESIHNSQFMIHNSTDIQPSQTLILNLEKKEEEILNDMHQKTRYNIRLAKKKGVKIREGEEKDFETWWKIMNATSGRDKFRLHNKEYYRKMIKLKNIKLYLAEYKDEIIAGNIISFFGDTATYLHGASANEYRNVMAPYFLQWHVIGEAKKKGCNYYDFFGISKEKWPGVTRFKKGFGGKEINYPGTFDLVFNKFNYNIYKFLRKIRRMF